MWLAEPRSSPAPHFDGQRALSGGGVHVGACASAALPPTSMAPITAPNAMRCMVSSDAFVVPAWSGAIKHALRWGMLQAPVVARARAGPLLRRLAVDH